MKRRKSWLGVALVGAISAACGDGDQLVARSTQDTPADSGPQIIPEDGNDAGVVQNPAADAAVAQSDAATSLVPVETALAGVSQTSSSRSYTMTSRLGASFSSVTSGEGTNYRMTTGVLALQGAGQ